MKIQIPVMVAVMALVVATPSSMAQHDASPYTLIGSGG